MQALEARVGTGSTVPVCVRRIPWAGRAGQAPGRERRERAREKKNELGEKMRAPRIHSALPSLAPAPPFLLTFTHPHPPPMEAPLARGAPAYTRVGGGEEGEDAGDVSSLKAALVHEGFPTLAAAARTRAAAVYYGFGMLSLGFLVVLVFAL